MNKSFLHLSDTHFLRQYPPGGQGYLSLFNTMTPPGQQIRRCFDLAAAWPLDFVLLTGDLTEGGQAEDYAALRAIFDQQLKDTPLLVTLGNHDVKPAFYEGWLGQPASQAPYNTVTELEGLLVISLDNSRAGRPNGEISRESLDWLEGVLAEAGGKPSILITHHHLLPGQYELPPAEGAGALAEIVAGSGILGVFCGHTHHNYSGWFAGKPYFTADSLSFAGKNDGGAICFEERSAAALFHLDEGRFSVRRFAVLPQPRRLARVSPQGPATSALAD
jgi:3',5'-cyclic AMP phosphodiesterase CpdA